MQEIYVIGGSHHNMLGVIRSLGKKGVYPNVVIESKNRSPYVARSKYINKSWIVDSEQQILDVLLKEQSFNGDRPVVIACADNLASLLDMHYNELSLSYKIPGAGQQGRITELMDKEIMSQFASESGLLVPKSQATDTVCSEEISVPMPWIIKPLLSKNGAKTDIERIYSLQDWSDYKKQHHLRVQVQQLIDKDFEYQLIGLSLDSGREVIIPGVSNVIRPQATTNTGFLHYCPIDDSYEEIIQLCKRFLQRASYSGLFSMEFLRGKDGKDYFMEINFRNDGNAISVTTAGVNLPYVWYLYCIGGDWKSELEHSIIHPVYVMPELNDVRFVLHRQLSLKKWIQDVHRTNAFMEYDPQDRIPFFVALWQMVAGGIKRKLIK